MKSTGTCPAISLDAQSCDHLWMEIYNIDGRGLIDYLNEWSNHDELDFACTRYGENIFLKNMVNPHQGTAKIFNRWSKWHHEVSYYFDGFINTYKDNAEHFPEITCVDDLKEIFIWYITRIVGMHEEAEYYGVELDDPFPSATFLFL